MKPTSKLSRLGFLQAIGVALYCSVVGFTMFNTGKVFGNDPSFLIPVSLLLLFIVSALLCATIVFYKPYTLFFDNKKKDAIELVMYTTMWLFIIFVVVISTVLIF